MGPFFALVIVFFLTLIAQKLLCLLLHKSCQAGHWFCTWFTTYFCSSCGKNCSDYKTMAFIAMLITLLVLAGMLIQRFFLS